MTQLVLVDFDDTLVETAPAFHSAREALFSFLEENGDKVQGSEVSGVVPSFDTIASGDYPVSRPLYFYIKGAHVGKIPGIQEYALEFTSKKAMGEDGYLPEKGLIPLSGSELKQIQSDVKNLNRLQM